MRHVREIAISDVDDAMRQAIERAARQCGCKFTVLEGLVTRDILIILHEAERPSARVIDQYERQEFLALPAIGEKQ